MVTFDDCMKNRLSTVERWHRQGIIDQETYEHYMYHWANSAPRFSDVGDAYRAEVCPVCGETFGQY